MIKDSGYRWATYSKLFCHLPMAKTLLGKSKYFLDIFRLKNSASSSLSPRNSVFKNHVSHVGFMVSKKQMDVFNAHRVIAFMKGPQSTKNFSIVDVPGQSAGKIVSRLNPKHSSFDAVFISHTRASPQPATGSFIDVLPESINDFLRNYREIFGRIYAHWKSSFLMPFPRHLTMRGGFLASIGYHL